MQILGMKSLSEDLVGIACYNTFHFSRKFTLAMGNFYDVSGGKKYYGSDIGLTVDIYAAAFPDMHRELDSFYFHNNVVIVELSLNGTHKGDLVTAAGTISATGKEIHAPCCDVFRIENEKVTSFHCYLAATIIQSQLGLT